MTTNELLESTMLHAMGMLEDSEIAAYETAFEAASPAIQESIRRESLRMADLGDLLPETEPRPELRELVLAAVRAAMQENANETRIASERSVAGRIHANPGARAGYVQPKLSRSPRVHRIWRGTSIGLAAAVVAMIAVTINVQQTYNHAGGDAFVSNLYDNIGAEFFDDIIFSNSTQHVVLSSANSETIPAGASMGASVHANPDWDSARLMVKNLRPQEGNAPYRLVVLDAEGKIVREVTRFNSNGEVQTFDIQVNLNTENHLAIYQAMKDEIAESEPLLVSDDQM